MSTVSETIKSTLGVDDEQAASTEAQIRKALADAGHDVSDDQVIQVISAVGPKLLAGGSSTQMKTPPIRQAPSTPAYAPPAFNAPEELGAAEDRYQKALSDIKRRRTGSNISQAMLSRFNPNRVEQNNKKFDAEAAAARDATLGKFERANTVTGQQSERDWNTTARARQQEGWNREDTKYQSEQEALQAAKDPNSDVSKASREALQQILKTSGIDIVLTGDESKEFIDRTYPMLKDLITQQVAERSRQENLQLRKDTLESQQAAREEARADRQLTRDIAINQRDETRQDRQEAKDDFTTQKLSKDVAGVQGMLDAVNSVENEIRTLTKDPNFSLDQPGDVDLPGVSVPGIGRTSFYSGPARQLAGSIARVFNTELKDRSGAAVTTPEMARLKTEFGAGRFNTESELISAMKRYRDLALTELKNREAAYTGDIKTQYQDQGGRLSGSYGGDATTGGATGHWEELPTVNTADEYNSLPSGAQYIDGRSGQPKRKK